MSLVLDDPEHVPLTPPRSDPQAGSPEPDPHPAPAPSTTADAHAQLAIDQDHIGGSFQAPTVGSPDGPVGQLSLPRGSANLGNWQTSDGSGTTDTAGVNVEASSWEWRHNRIPGVPIQDSVRGPDAQAVATASRTVTRDGVETDSFALGATANAASTAVALGDAHNSVRLGASEGIGAGVRGHVGDDHGRIRLGVGADIGPFSVDINAEGAESPQDRALRERNERDHEWAARTVREQDEAARAAQAAQEAAARQALVARDLGTGGDGTGEGARRAEREAAFHPDPAQVDQEAQLRQQLHAPRHNGLVRVDTRDYHAEMSPSEVEALIGRIHSNSEVAALTHGHR